MDSPFGDQVEDQQALADDFFSPVARVALRLTPWLVTWGVLSMMFYVIEKETVIWRPRTLKAVCGRDFHLVDYKIDLPRVGKDIQLTFNKESKSGNSWLLKWNGSGFNVIKK